MKKNKNIIRNSIGTIPDPLVKLELLNAAKSRKKEKSKIRGGYINKTIINLNQNIKSTNKPFGK